ncbi:MAG TPA: methyltransferase [Acidobacteriaceae bacterium]|nr:methyltransferase [Acidobacteriaceae bacterium]
MDLDLAARSSAAEQMLLLHPGVQSAAVFSPPSSSGADRLLALVVPAEMYLDESLDRLKASAAALRKWKKTYDLNQSSKAAVSAPSGFNTVGWDSSFTRLPLPAEDMREWVQTSVDSILRLGAHSIYEIGCGSGLLLLRLAPHCDRYAGVDFSHEVLARLHEQLQLVPDVASRVELMERTADNFAGLQPRSFDAVIINSASQYFPHSGYLAQVLENAVGLVRDGGHIFVGDVRSLPLLPAFAASVELFQAPDDLSVADLRERSIRRLRHTPELVLSPAWFFALRQRLDRIAHVEIALRRGRADNEMTRYRYNAILRVGPESEPIPVPVPVESASADPIGRIRGRLQQSRDPFTIGCIPNARIEKDLVTLELLRTPDRERAVSRLRHELGRYAVHGVHPQDLFDLEAEHPGLRVLLSWSASRPDGSYDALFIPAGAPGGTALTAPGPSPCAQLRLANAPGQIGIRSELTERLLAHCREHLPESAVPDRLVFVDAIPAGLDFAACEERFPPEDEPLLA